MTTHAQFLCHNPLQLQPHVVHHRVQAFCARARKNLKPLRIYFTNDCACAVPLPQSLHLQPHVVHHRVQAFCACARKNLKALHIYFLQMTAHAKFLRHNPLQLQPHVVQHRVQAVCACARKNLKALRIYFVQMTAHAQILQSAPATTTYHPPLITGFLRMRKEEFRYFSHLFFYK
jgi:hypothetical protein